MRAIALPLTTTLTVVATLAFAPSVAVHVPVSAAQQAVPGARAEDVDSWLRSADVLRKTDRAAASSEYLRALDAARQLGLEAQQGYALCALAEIDFEQGRYPQARERGEQSAALYDRLAGSTRVARTLVLQGIGRSSTLLSIIAARDGRHEYARQQSERAVAAFDEAGDRRGRAVATLQMLRTTERGNEGVSALYDRAIDDARAVSDRALEASALHSLGDALFTRGELSAALPKLEAAAALYEAAGRRVDLGTVYNSLGRLYRAHGRADAALVAQLTALSIHEKADSPFAHVQSLNAVAVTYQYLGDNEQAKRYFSRALALAERASTARMQDFLRANLAVTLNDGGEYREAADVLEGVVARGLDTYPALRMRDLTDAYLGLGRLETARAWAEKAVAACGSEESIACIHAYDRRAGVHAAMGNDEAALADLRTAMKIIESARGRLVPADFLKQRFHAVNEDLYSRTIALQIRRERVAEALETAERARSRGFVDLLASRNLPLTTDAAVAAPNPPGSKTSAGESPLVFRGAQAGAGAAGGATTDLLSDAAVPSASRAELTATAARLGSTLLAYWVTRNEIFIWVVRPDGGVRAARADVRLARLLELTRATTPVVDSARSRGERQLATRGAAVLPLEGTDPAAWRELYDLLIKPVRAALPRNPGALLTIVPHGPLGAVAFAGLQDERGRYLLEDYTLHYAPSGAALQFTAAKRRTDSRRGSMLLVADPRPPSLSNLDRPLPRLPGARTEGRAIASLIPRARLARYEGDAADESIVRTAAAGKAVLHFATHAIVRDDDPFASFLALAPAAPTDDGLLTAQEIYRLRLDADLVVLSACRTAGGRVTGDGIATFARAFIYAGAPSIVASLWDVADEPTNRLIPHFYRSWLRDGASKARALRSAQLRLLSDLRRGAVRIETPAGLVALPEHPVFWAGFSLIGEPD